MSTKDKWVRRFSVDETAKHKNGFTIYKITSILFPIESPETITVVSVWKRYSDVQHLHKSMRSLHAGLHLRGTFPVLSRYSYFKRFQKEVIDDRAKTIKGLLEFIAEHRLLFTSTVFVNFLQTGYPEPEAGGSVINAIRSSLHLPIEETPPLEYQTDEDDTRSPTHSAHSHQSSQRTNNMSTINETDISQIPIYEATNVELREPPPKMSTADSFESLNSLESINSDLYEELNKVTIDKRKPSVKMLPDLINFEEPSTSRYEDYRRNRNANASEDVVSVNSTVYSMDSTVYSEDSRGFLASGNNPQTEDSYVFEAGIMLNLAAKCEDMGDYTRAFECYKSGIEKMLIGVRTDSDAQRRAIIKEKTNKYLSYAENIYKQHLRDLEQQSCQTPRPLLCPLPASMLRRPPSQLAHYKVLGVIGGRLMLVLHSAQNTCYAIKVIQKIPHNLTEFDEYVLQHTNETRQPILPTNVPYMVPLHAFIETNNLIFLVLSYAPGQRLFDYIRHYAKSVPNTPVRQVNLDNVFPEPSKQRNVDSVDSTSRDVENSNVDMSTKELVMNSQRLLSDVDRVLSQVKSVSDLPVGASDVDDIEFIDKDVDEVDRAECVDRIDTPLDNRPVNKMAVLPAGAIRRWAAELLVAVDTLHNAGVICRDLNPSNILLGDRGQIILTYFVGYAGLEMSLRTVRRQTGGTPYVAPELYGRVCVRGDGADDPAGDKLCDYWSYGAVLYELLCGMPLCFHHRSGFTSHTILQVPEGLSLEAESILTQLLTYDPSERLGSGKDGVQEIKNHPYFKNVDWSHIYDSWIVPG